MQQLHVLTLVNYSSLSQMISYGTPSTEKQIFSVEITALEATDDI